MNVAAKAVNEMRTRGMHKGNFANARGEVCALGALQVAAGGNVYVERNPFGPTFAYVHDYNEHLFRQAYTYVQAAFMEQYPDFECDSTCSATCSWIQHFNDHPDTKQEQVEAILEKAAVKMDECVA